MDAQKRLNECASDLRSALMRLDSGATWLDKVIEETPEYATEELRSISSQIWAMADVARSCENVLARVRADLRTTQAS